MAWDAVIFDFEDTLVDLSRGRPTKGAPMYFAGAKGVPLIRDPNGQPFVDVLGRLVEQGTPVAIVTNSPEAAMGRWFAEQHFAHPVVVVGFHDTVLHRPSPHPLLEALARLGVAPSPRVLAVGDSSDDIEAAQRAGLTSASIRDRVPLCRAPDLLYPFVESFFDDEQVFSLAGDYETDLPGVMLEAQFDNYVCRVAGRARQDPHNRLAAWIEQGRAGSWHTEVVELGVTLVAHSLGSDREGAVLTWIPAHAGATDSMQDYMGRLKAATGLTTTRLLEFIADPGEQSRRGRERREKGMDASMTLRGNVDLSGRTVVVVDDTRHTGATLAEAARALLAGGAAKVIGVALAQEEYRAHEPLASYGPLGSGQSEPEFLNGEQAAALGAVELPEPEEQRGLFEDPASATRSSPPEAVALQPASVHEVAATAQLPVVKPVPAPAENRSVSVEPGKPVAPTVAPAKPHATPVIKPRPVARPLSGARQVAQPQRPRGASAQLDGPLVARPNAAAREHQVESQSTHTDPLVVVRGKRKAPPPRTPAEVKARYPRAYQRWTPEEDKHLSTVFVEGLSLDAMADALGRQPKAVETRIRKLDIDIRPGDLSDALEGNGEATQPDVQEASSQPAAQSSAPGALAAEMKRRYPRAYQPWTPEEDQVLRRLHAESASKKQMVAELQRQPKAVESRVRKLGIDVEELSADGEEVSRGRALRA